jgi:nucleoid DNA-binding protein
MKKQEIAKQMARQSGGTQGEAADRLDRVVSEILERLREGKSAHFPGMGHFRPGAGGKVAFQRDRGRGDA